MSKRWYESSWRRLLVDMHINDKDERFLSAYDSERYASMMEMAGIDTAEIYSSNALGLCFWPSKVGFPHKQLHGRDLLGDTVEACRKRGINVQIYLNVWSRAPFDAYPDWRIRYHDGSDSVARGMRFGLCCHNSPFGEYFVKYADELASRYECAGYWVDMIGFFSAFCYCKHCRARFARETGYDELPRNVDFNDPHWLAFMEARRRWLVDFATKIKASLQRYNPARSVNFQATPLCHGCGSDAGVDFGHVSDYLAGDFTGDSIQQSYICKEFSAISSTRPMEFMTPRCETLLHHTTTRSEENLTMRLYASITNQAAFTLIDAIDPVGTLDQRFYELAHRINARLTPFIPFLSSDSIPLADVAIYDVPGYEIPPDLTPYPVSDFPRHTPNPWKASIVQTLARSHALFSFATKADALSLERFPLIILSDQAALSDEECNAIRDYVRNGGRIYASARTSLFDPLMGKRTDFALADVFGVHCDASFTDKDTVTYIAPANASPLAHFSTPDYPVMLDGRQCLITADADSEVLGTLTLPFSKCTELANFSSGISNPPMIATGRPALVRHRYGRGEVIYCAGRLEVVPFELHRDIMNALLRELLPTRLIETDLPTTAEVTLFMQPSHRRLIVNILNLPADLPAVPLFSRYLTLNLPTGLMPQRILSVPDGGVTSIHDPHPRLDIPKLERFAMFSIDY